MTKKELLELLKDYPDDAEVCYLATDYIATPVYVVDYDKKRNRIELF